MQFLPSSGRVDTAISMLYIALTKSMYKRLDSNYTRMLWAMLNKSWRQQPTKQQLYGHLTPIMKTLKVRRTRHAGHCWRSRDELVRNVLLWDSLHGRAKVGRPAGTYVQQLCADTEYIPEDLPDQWAIGKSSERGSGISALTAQRDDDEKKSYGCIVAGGTLSVTVIVVLIAYQNLWVMYQSKFFLKNFSKASW